jgi:putative DNA primase/helicase
MNHCIPENLRRVLGRLRDARQNGKGWLARCPAHDDRKASLSIAAGENGRVLLHCFAGCSFEAVKDALRLDVADLAPAADLATSPGRQRKGRIVATYDYRDEAGQLVYQVVRFDPKNFCQRRPDPNKAGGWDWKLGDVRRVLYRLPEILAADVTEPVYLTEGEKDADRLAALGFVSTTAPGGAGKWRDAYRETLRGRLVVLLPDNDEPGRAHVETIGRSVAMISRETRVLMLPNLPEKGDVSNWLDGGGTAELLRELTATAPIWMQDEKQLPDDRPAFVRMSDVAGKPVEWLWPGRFPLGKLSLICGDPGTSKSLLVCDLAARISCRLPWPDAPAHDSAGDVWLISLEDDLADTIRPRLDAAGADVSRVHALQATFALDADLDRLELALSETPMARLLVIDPISACLGRVDSHKNADVRGALAPLALLAARRNVAVICVHHLNKSATGPALYRAAGSLAFAAAARAVWLVAKDRGDERRRLLLPIKSNLSEALTGLAYRIESDEARGVGRLVWDDAPILQTADEALAMLTDDEREKRHERHEAKAWLLETLVTEPIASKDLQALAKEAGHAWGTVRRALRDVNARSYRRGGGRDAKWYWRILVSDDDRPLLAGLDDADALNEPTPHVVELAARGKPQ